MCVCALEFGVATPTDSSSSCKPQMYDQWSILNEDFACPITAHVLFIYLSLSLFRFFSLLHCYHCCWSFLQKSFVNSI